MKEADKPAGKASLKKTAGLQTNQAVTKNSRGEVKASVKSTAKSGTTVKKKEVITRPVPRVKKSTPKPSVKKTSAKATNKKATTAPDLNKPGYPLHPTRIWPD